MSLLMLLIARPYAPLAARGALVDGWLLRPSFRCDNAEPRSRFRETRLHARRTLRAHPAHARCADEPLAA